MTVGFLREQEAGVVDVVLDGISRLTPINNEWDGEWATVNAHYWGSGQGISIFSTIPTSPAASGYFTET